MNFSAIQRGQKTTRNTTKPVRGKPFTLDQMPGGGNYTFGKEVPRDAMGVRGLTTQWKMNEPRSSLQVDSKLDYQKLNKLQIKEKIHNNSQVIEFRASNQHVRVSQPTFDFDRMRTRNNSQLMTIADLQGKSFCHGIPNKPSTPIKGVISHALLNSQSRRLKGDLRRTSSFVEQKVSPKRQRLTNATVL